ncbi:MULTISPECIES: RDD family protein [unclassified Luteibacter]|uniref:RDD family protein n=1 Tax=Luteibacter sp. PvP019 TaxID=3156436 RepID=UPI00339393D0
MQVWIGRNGERFGPYTDDEVRQWLRDGTCRPDELGWHEGMTDWRALSELFPDERPAVAPGAVPPPPPPFFGIHDATVEPEHAGFWLRLGAWVIDYIVLMVPFTFISLMMGMGDVITSTFARMEHDQAAAVAAYAEAMRPISYVVLLVGFAYYVLFESSKWQATPGKMACGIRVTDTAGQRLTLGRAAARNAVRLLNAVTLLVPMVFYVTAAFTQRKQGVHDLLASTYVVMGRVGRQPRPAPQGGVGGSFDA